MCPYPSTSLGITDASRKVTGKFGAYISTNFCPLITTKNSRLLLMKQRGAQSSKVVGHGRMLEPEEICNIQGVVYASLSDLMSPRQIHLSLGNMLPVNLAGVVLRQIMDKWAIFERKVIATTLTAKVPSLKHVDKTNPKKRKSHSDDKTNPKKRKF